MNLDFPSIESPFTNVLKFPQLAPMETSVGGTPMGRIAYGYIKGRIDRREIKRLTGYRNLGVLRGFCDSFGNRPVSNLSRRDIEVWMAKRSSLSAGTRLQEVATLRAFCRWLQRERHIKHDPMMDIRNPRVPRTVPRALSRDEINALYAVLPDNRARAIFALMRGLGLRKCEVLSVEVGDWDRGAATIRVKGKGGHERIVPVTEHETVALEAYVAETGVRAGVLIRRLDGTGPLSSSRLHEIMREWMETAGVKHRAYDGRACHSLRHTLASEVADVEPDLRVLQQLLGHVSLSSTQVYLRNATLAKVRAAMEASA